MPWVNEFLKENGAITGGDYESDMVNRKTSFLENIILVRIIFENCFQGCHPYSIKPCGSIIGTKLPCAEVLSPKCRQHRCTNENYRYAFEHPKRVYKGTV